MSLTVAEKKALISEMSITLYELGSLATKVEMNRALAYGEKEKKAETKILWVRTPFLLTEL